MKKLFLIILISAAFSSKAQTSNNHPSQSDSLTIVALNKIGATTSQITQFIASKHSYAQQVKAIRLNTTLTDEQKQLQIRQLNEQKNASYKQILGADKYREYNHSKSETPVEE